MKTLDICAENSEKSQPKESKKWKMRLADKLRSTVLSDSSSAVRCTFGVPLDKCVASPTNEVSDMFICIEDHPVITVTNFMVSIIHC